MSLLFYVAIMLFANNTSSKFWFNCKCLIAVLVEILHDVYWLY